MRISSNWNDDATNAVLNVSIDVMEMCDRSLRSIINVHERRQYMVVSFVDINPELDLDLGIDPVYNKNNIGKDPPNK